MTIHQDVTRPPIYEQKGTWFYRASVLGGCINELVLFRKGEVGTEPSTYIEQILEAGKEYEDEVRIQVAQQNDMTVLSDSEPVELEVAEGHVVVGNTDGRMSWSATKGVSPERGVEIKTLGEDSYATFVRTGLEKFPEYQWQLSAYMHGVGLPWLYAAALRTREKVDDEWVFSVDLSQIHTLPIIKEPPISLSRIRRKVRRINTLAEMEMTDLPPCEKTKFCSMVRFHDLIGGNIEAEQAERIDENDELHDLLVKRQELKDLEDVTSRERKTVDIELKRLMEGPAAIEGWGHWVPVFKPGRMTLDRKQLAMDLGDGIKKYERVGNPYQEIRFYREKT